MKKLILFLLFVVFHITFIYSQNKILTRGEAFKIKYGNTPIVFVEPDGHNGYLILRYYLKMFKGGGYFLSRVDSNMNVIHEHLFKLYAPRLESMFVRDDKVYLIEVVNKNGKYIFNKLSSPISKFDFKRDELLTISKKEIKRKYFYFNNDHPDEDVLTNIFISKNKKFFTLCYRENIRKIEKHHFIVFNDKFEQIYSSNFTKKIKNKLYQIQRIFVSDLGEIYFISKVYENGSKKTKRKGKTNYHYELNKISKTGNSYLTIKLGKHLVKDLFFSYNKNYMVCSGYYSDKDEDRVKGVCRFDIDRDSMKVLKTYFIPFTKKYYMDKYGKIKHKETKDLELSFVHLTNRGNIILDGEEIETVSYSTFDHKTGTFDNNSGTYRKFNDIFSAKISLDGKVIWMRNIKKRQKESSLHTHSFYSVSTKDKDYILLNSKWFKQKKMKFYGKTGSKSNLFLIELSGKGKIRIKKVLDRSKNIIPMQLMDGELAPKTNEIIFYGKKGVSTQFTKVKIKDLVF